MNASLSIVTRGSDIKQQLYTHCWWKPYSDLEPELERRWPAQCTEPENGAHHQLMKWKQSNSTMYANDALQGFYMRVMLYLPSEQCTWLSQSYELVDWSAIPNTEGKKNNVIEVEPCSNRTLLINPHFYFTAGSFTKHKLKLGKYWI